MPLPLSSAQPPLAYVAPELALSGGGATGGGVSPAIDAFSLALTAYHVLSKRPLLGIRNSLSGAVALRCMTIWIRSAPARPGKAAVCAMAGACCGGPLSAL